MFLMDNVVVTSPSDLTTASKCEFAFARLLDGKLGRVEIEKVARDALEQRASDLGMPTRIATSPSAGRSTATGSSSSSGTE